MYVEVSIPIALFKTFTYIVPNKYRKNIFLGQSVIISFNNKKINGFITEIKSQSKYKGKLLNIIKTNNNSFLISSELWKTINWISTYYICPLGKVLNNTISYQHKSKYTIPLIQYIKITLKGKQAISTIKYKAQKKILEILDSHPDNKVNINEFKSKVSSYMQVCNRLEENKYIQIESTENIKGILNFNQHQLKLKLTKIQNNIFKAIENNLNTDYKKPILLSGIPGSGKTMVYIKAMGQYINNNKSIIVLVPEISLIQQTYEQINNYYPDIVGVWHSKLSQTEKNYILKQLKSDKIKIIVGTRSSLFMPFMSLGLIIVDEEQEFSYKQALNAPFYHARDVALMRAKFSKSSVLLISSAPSIETYFNIQKRKYYNHILDEKYFKNTQLSKVQLVEMSNQKGILSDVLIKNITDTLSNNEQVILLQNKKGLDGGGIQKIESILYKFFPKIKILRYDGDSIQKSKEYYNILNAFKEGNADILLGTQMIAKGLDFSDVSLVGIISADIGLFVPDFRSGEKTFQLIYQLIGRTGRRDKSSMAIVQSHNTDDFYIQNACDLQLEETYNRILEDRKELNYPPFSRLIKILFLGKKEIDAKKKSQRFLSILKKNSNIQILGPSLAPIEYITPYWRYQILIKCKKNYWQKFHTWIKNNISFSELENQNQNIKIKIDVDPISTL